jgi:putative transposase
MQKLCNTINIIEMKQGEKIFAHTNTKIMTYNPDIHHRRSIRLKSYDYSQAGLYFVTICTHQRLPLFGEIIKGEMILNEAGMVAEKCWLAIPEHFPQVKLDEFVIMPNHVHGIIQIDVGAKNLSPLQTTASSRPTGTSKTIGSIVRGFKIGVTKWFRTNSTTHCVWHRNYHEHIIRDENAYLKIANYVQTNPQKWQEDCFFEDVKGAAMVEFRKLN